MVKLFLPESVAHSLENDRLDEMERLRLVAKSDLSKELSQECMRISDAESQMIVRAFCGKLLNMRGAIVSQQLSLPEIGRLVSDALLGANVEYEIKT